MPVGSSLSTPSRAVQAARRARRLGLAGFIVGLVVVSLTVGPVYALDPVAAEVEKARKCSKTLDSEGALSHYNKALAAKPKADELYFERGGVYKDLGKFDLALADYNRALALSSGDINYLGARARLYDMTGKLKEAIADYDTILKLRKTDWGAWFHRGICNRRLKNYLESAKDFGHALEVSGPTRDIPKTMYYQAEMLYMGNDLKGALEHFDEVIRRFPQFSGSYWARAKVYDKLGKTALAEKDRQTARKMDEDIDPLNRF